jgi:hypothetical protein
MAGKSFLLIALLFQFYIVKSQSVISSAGGSHTAQNLSVSYTLGESAISQQTSPAITNAQGFQQPEIPRLNTKIFLQGFYTGGNTMNAVLDPLNLPQYADSITLSLMSSAPPHSLLWSKSVLLDINGNAFTWLPASMYRKNAYLKINHRNHLETWSKTPFLFRTMNTIDFATP